MRPSRFTEEQIVQALEKARNGTPALHVCRELGITQTTFYRWREKYGSASMNEARELHALRVENQQLRQIVSNLLLEKESTAPARRKK